MAEMSQIVGALFGSSAIVISDDAPQWQKLAGRTLHLLVGDAVGVCDGADDDVQIQAAIDALPATGGEVLLLDGTYNIEVSLVLDSYQTLRGCGRNTILTTTTADLDIITAIGGAGTEKVGILIADLCVDGAAGGAVDDVGILFQYVNESKVAHVWSINHGEDGIKLEISCQNEIMGNTVQGNVGHGITLSNECFSNITIGNTVQMNGPDGIFVNFYSSKNITIGNTVQGHSGDGIAIINSSKNIVIGNTCFNNNDGIYLYNSIDNTIIGNNCQKNGEYGIKVKSASNNNIILGNNCSINSQAGDDTSDNILIEESDRNLIEGNTCRAPTIGTTLTVGEAGGATDIHVTDTTGFVVGMGVVIDLGGVNEEYHWISAITDGAPGIITIPAPGLANVQGAGETIDVPEARYGINISDAVADYNTIQGNQLYDSGKSANINDVGTCTIVRDDNRDITPVQVKHLVYAQNTSGGNLTTGNVVSYEAAATAVGFETPTAIGDPKVWGMLVEDINDTAYGYIQTLGGTVLLDATNAGGGAIVIGDLLCTEVGSRARKAAAGHVCFAIAMEDLDAVDGIINALLITPRMM